MTFVYFHCYDFVNIILHAKSYCKGFSSLFPINGMDPFEIEFIAENKIISIIPNFTYEKLYLICGEFGPFRAGLPVNVPLWLATMFKQKQRCRIVPPDWMELENLENIKEEEKRSRFFTKMPSEHYMIEAKLILGLAPDDVPRASEINTIIKDIWDIRMSKLRTSMDAMMKTGSNYGRLDHLTMLEINSARELLTSTMDQKYLLELATSKRADVSSNLNMSSFNQSGGSQNV